MGPDGARRVGAGVTVSKENSLARLLGRRRARSPTFKPGAPLVLVALVLVVRLVAWKRLKVH